MKKRSGDLAKLIMEVFAELKERYPEYSDEIAVILNGHFKLKKMGRF